MPTKTTRQSAHRKARRGNKPTTQAGAYVAEELHKFKRGRGNARSRKQAVAIGLSEARQDGVCLKRGGKRKRAEPRAASGGRPRRSTGGRRGAKTSRGKPSRPRK